MYSDEWKQFKEWRDRQQNLPLAVLIKEPNCAFNCSEGHKFDCGCDKCVGSGLGPFNSTEVENRRQWPHGKAGSFSEKDIEVLSRLFDNRSGYLGTNGCRLERRLRPVACLRTICRPWKWR